MAIYTGMDVASIERIRRAMSPRFLERVYTEAEAAYSLGRKDPARHLAGRFAAKEACIKALSSVPSGPIPFRDIEVVSGPAAPAVVLHGAAARLLGDGSLFISISYTGRLAVAFAVVERGRTGHGSCFLP